MNKKQIAAEMEKEFGAHGDPFPYNEFAEWFEKKMAEERSGIFTPFRGRAGLRGGESVESVNKKQIIEELRRIVWSKPDEGISIEAAAEWFEKKFAEYDYCDEVNDLAERIFIAICGGPTQIDDGVKAAELSFTLAKMFLKVKEDRSGKVQSTTP